MKRLGLCAIAAVMMAAPALAAEKITVETNDKCRENAGLALFVRARRGKDAPLLIKVQSFDAIPVFRIRT